MRRWWQATEGIRFLFWVWLGVVAFGTVLVVTAR